MKDALTTEQAQNYFIQIKPPARDVLTALNDLEFFVCYSIIGQIRATVDVSRGDCSSEDFLNDMYVLSAYAGFLSSYIRLWSCISSGKFSASWNSLQDCFDGLRAIKRFSKINVESFEDQLLALEKLYPYTIFFSIGAESSAIICSLCDEDMSSERCPHIANELYAGRLAQGILKDIQKLDHVAVVPNPADKRCVVRYDDAGEEFKLVRFLCELINERRLRILDFGVVQTTVDMRPDINFRKLNRNEKCFCGSGKKFKKCCSSRELVEHEHVDIIARPQTPKSMIV